MTSSLPKPRYYLVRHGESITNINKDFHRRIADPAVFLTPRGHQQATEAGKFFVSHFANMPDEQRPRKLRIMRSNYRRAIQTAEHIADELQASNLIPDIEVRDMARLRELEFGYTGHADARLSYVEWLSDLLRYQGYKFYAKRFGGEAPSDVDIRARLALASMYRDQAKHDVNDFIVVNHGLTMRVLIAILTGASNEWYEKEPNPDNCAIRMVQDGKDSGFLFPNPTGNWDPDYVEPPEDLSRLNSHGQFFSPTELDYLIELQNVQPDIMDRIGKLFDQYTGLKASDAITMATNSIGDISAAS